MTNQPNAPTVSTDKHIAIPHYGTPEEVKELAERIKMMMPGGTKYTNDEALTLAQMSVSTGLNVYNGEAWLIKSEDTGKIYGSLVGLKGLRKQGKRQAVYWGEFVRIVRVEEYNAPPNSIVYEYHLMDEVTSRAWSKTMANLRRLGYTLDEAIKMAGKYPVTIGVGIWSPGDKTKMKPAQCAMFRAEKDGLKRRFDVLFFDEQLPMPVIVGDVDEEREGDEYENGHEVEPDEPLPIEGEPVAVAEPSLATETPAEKAERLAEREKQIQLELGYGV